MNLNSLNDVYVHQLTDLYSAEKQVLEAMPDMIEAAASPILQKALRNHMEQSRAHLERLQNILAEMNENPRNTRCEGMEGLIREGDEVVKVRGSAAPKDAALVAAAQRIEHYEMAGYGTARTYAQMLGHQEAADLLGRTLEEESLANDALTEIAVGGLLTKGINERAI